MADYASMKHGGVTYPVPLQDAGVGGTGAPILRDIDPPIFYMLEFFASVLATHLGDRFDQEVAAAQVDDRIPSVVAYTMPLDPEPYLTEEHIQFPLLAASRKSSVAEYIGQYKRSVDTVEVVYVLPPMARHEAERVVPFLRAVAAVIDDRSELGHDPGYTPTLPAGAADDRVWAADRAGIDRIEVIAKQYGGYQPSADMFFPAVLLTLVVKERAETVMTDFETYGGADADVDAADLSDGSTIETIAETQTYAAPVLTSVAPTTGTKAGGTAVTLTCTGLIVGRSYRVLFDGSDASSVLATATTTLTCLTPQMDAYPTRAADIVILDQDAQESNTLEDAFTFTTP